MPLAEMNAFGEGLEELLEEEKDSLPTPGD